MWRNFIGALVNNHVKAGESWFYPDLTPVELQGSRSDVIDRVEEAFDSGGPRWTGKTISVDEGRLTGIVETQLLGFRDDFTAVVEPTDDANQWRVVARSSSRTGIGDFGKNARNIRNFYERLRDSD